MKEKKLIKKDCYNMLLNIEEVANNETLVNFINKELELLSKKSTSKNSKRGEEVALLSEKIVNAMNPTENYTATAIGNLIGLSSQKIVPILKIMVANNVLIRIENKREVLYTLV